MQAEKYPMECLWNLYNALTRMRRRRKKEKDTLCTLRGLTIEMTTNAKSLDIWYGDYCLNGKSMGVVLKKQ